MKIKNGWIFKGLDETASGSVELRNEQMAKVLASSSFMDVTNEPDQ